MIRNATSVQSFIARNNCHEKSSGVKVDSIWDYVSQSDDVILLINYQNEPIIKKDLLRPGFRDD